MTLQHNAPLVLLAAGGTGGHIFPAEALADALSKRGIQLAFVTDRRGAAYEGVLARLPTYRVAAGGLAGRSVKSGIVAFGRLILGMFQAFFLLRRLRPAMVVGFGSYLSVPPLGVAQLLRISTIIHEQNAVLGRANKLLAVHATRIATAFVHVEGLSEDDAARTIRTGNPVRPTVTALSTEPYPEPKPQGPLNILVLGGSQGATIFADVVPMAIAQLSSADRARIYITQQCRTEDISRVEKMYEQIGIKAELASFITNVPDRLKKAHLVICRAGASTAAELTVSGRPAILVPYPYATDDHQTENARNLADAGGAWVMPQPTFTAEALTQRLAALLALPQTLITAARCARQAGIPMAAERLADLVIESLPGNSKKNSANHGRVAA